MKHLVFRVLAVAYIVMFILYFIFRGLFSIGDKVYGWRLFVLLVEFFSSVNVVFVVIMKIRNPWTEHVGQLDGTMMSPEFTMDQVPPRPTEADAGDEELRDFNDDLDEDIVSTPQSRLVGPVDDVDNKSDYGASEKLDDEDDEDDGTNTSGGSKPAMAADRVGDEKPGEQFHPYVVRVLVPCYKETLDIIQPTILAALKMKHDTDKLFVYLCDDGADPLKQQWVADMNQEHPNLIYVTRPKEFKGHGKAGNLNYCLREIIYKNVLSHNENLKTEDGKTKRKKFIPRKELVVIFDADMVARSNFLTRLLPYFSKNRRCVLVQSPQTFHNVPMDADFFDAHNVNFFQYMLPCFSSWNTTTCCGTNFIVAARALQTVNFFPTISVTEDMYLAMLLCAAGGVLKYHSENLVVGEAPQDLRQIFQQRSRWAKGTIEVFYKDNPLFKKGLPFMAKLSFFNACWSYFTSALFNPLFVLMNAAGILFGLFPVADLTFGTSLLFVMYYALFYSMIHATPVPHKHYIGLWVVGKMGHFFSFMSLKAIVNITLSLLGFKKKAVFKVTNKKAKIGQQEKVERSDRDSSHRDIIFHWIMCTFIILTILYGIYTIAGGKHIFDIGAEDERNEYQRKGIQVFMTFWMVQFLIAYSLPLWYAYLPQDFSIQAKALKYLSMFDTFLSLSLVVLTALLFKVPFLIDLPKLNGINDPRFTPNPTPYWITSLNELETVGSYIYDSALSFHVPTIVIYNRPGRDENMMSSGGLADWVSYRSSLKSVAETLADKAFPTVVVFEPDWMLESLYIANSTADPYYYTPVVDNLAESIYTASLQQGVKPSPPNAGTPLLAWNVKKFYRALNSFVEFAASVPSHTYLYLDAGHPYYHQVLKNAPMAVLNHSLHDKDIPFRGVSLNVANFYSSDDVMKYGTQMHNKYGYRFIEDSARNGGAFSRRTMSSIDSCRFDPPFVDQGELPTWYLDTSASTSNGEEVVGLDAKLWIKPLGESDGRMYPAGESHGCLVNHNIECDAVCPEVPYRDPVTGRFTHPSKCKCD